MAKKDFIKRIVKGSFGSDEVLFYREEEIISQDEAIREFCCFVSKLEKITMLSSTRFCIYYTRSSPQWQKFQIAQWQIKWAYDEILTPVEFMEFAEYQGLIKKRLYDITDTSKGERFF